LKLVNDDTHAIRNVALRATPLVNGSGGVIPPQAVRLPAGPISLPPGAARDLDLAVAVPNGSPPGLYTGLLQSTTPDDFASVLAVLVEQATQEE
jgi:hypothetical protein